MAKLIQLYIAYGCSLIELPQILAVWPFTEKVCRPLLSVFVRSTQT